MTVTENENFQEVILYETLNIEDILSACQTEHLSSERKERFELALRLNRKYEGKGKNKTIRQTEIDKVFLVDKGHEAGKELHCVTKKGIIFILNERKYLMGYGALITALIARRNQIIRLYKACNLYAPQEIIDRCKTYVEQGYNEK